MESREQPGEANLQGKPESSFCSALRCVHKIDLKNVKTQRKKSNICWGATKIRSLKVNEIKIVVTFTGIFFALNSVLRGYSMDDIEETWSQSIYESLQADGKENHATKLFQSNNRDDKKRAEIKDTLSALPMIVYTVDHK